MVKLIMGLKGSGKTKKLVDLVREAVNEGNGDVVCIEKGTKLRFDVKYQARLINVDDYYIDDAHSLCGFIAGILASNHDVTELFVDSALKICNNNVAEFETLVTKVSKLAENLGTKILFTVSMPVEEASETLRQYI